MSKEFVKRNTDVSYDKNLVNQLAEELEIPALLSNILLSRGLDVDDIRMMIKGNLNDLHDPFLFKDMSKAVDRVNKAIDNKENIAIWGDFDADGISATSILMLELSNIVTGNLTYYIPNRITEGYGVNKEGIKQLHKENVDLIITVDCGITSIEEVEYAKTLGIDFIITDHHRADKGLPEACAVINPKVEGETYPFDGLCGAGVAAKLAQAIIGPESLMRTIDIVALATVADLVPLVNENRILVEYGLKAINYMKRPAIYELSKYALKDPNETIKSYHFGFQFGPMINASGRLGDAKDAVELFITEDEDKRFYLANKLHEYNNTRKTREQFIYDEAEEMMKDMYIDKCIVVHDKGKGWEPGIVGIVASRLLEKYHLPTIVLAYNEETGMYKGSGRSIPGIDLYDALLNNEKWLGKWGGHAPAAGLEIHEDNIESFRVHLNNYLNLEYDDKDFVPTVKYDIEVDLKDINYDFVKSLELLEPTGIGNPKISLKTANVFAENVKTMGKNNEHFSAYYKDNTDAIRGVSFQKKAPQNFSYLDIVFYPSINEFRGTTSIQLMVSDYLYHQKDGTDPYTNTNVIKDNSPSNAASPSTSYNNSTSYNASTFTSNTASKLKDNVVQIGKHCYLKEEYENIKFSSPPKIIPIENFIKSKAKINQFKNIDIHNNIDLLNFAPIRYYDLISVHTVNSLTLNKDVEELNSLKDLGMVHIVGQIISVKTSGNHIFATAIDTDGNSFSVAWFNQSYVRYDLETNVWYSFCGIVNYNPMYKLQIVPSMYSKDLDEYKKIVPHYSKIKGMSDKYLRESINKAFEVTESNDYLEEALISKYNLYPQPIAYKKLHNPLDFNDIRYAFNRLVFDKLFVFDITNSYINNNQNNLNYFKIEKRELVDRVISNLPFDLTKDQLISVNESIKLMNSDVVLKSLVQGDVGSGKTIVSFLLMLAAIDNGYQSALVAPTEVLAKQHYEDFMKLLKDNNLDINIKCLTGSLTQKNKEDIYDEIKDGKLDVVIGTHAIIQDSVQFRNLAVLVIDEQHRFGVKQREKLSNVDKKPHIISMSATPIPRTLSMATYGSNIKVFNIKTMPLGRKEIQTKILYNDHDVYDFINSEVLEGRQAYVVCPLIEKSTSDKMKHIKSLEEEYEDIKEYFRKYPEVRIEMISGRMKKEEIEEVIKEYENGYIDILLSTTIIEVGINIPNSTVMVIKSSDRFGLAQLHQLRGRVGRGTHQSYCVLQPTNPNDIKAQIMANTNDGFAIAKEDLKLRGPGDFLGTNQTGRSEELSLILTNPKLYDIINLENKNILEDKKRFKNYKWIIDEYKSYKHEN